MNEIRFGESIPRREDDRLLTGRGQYVDDVRLAGELFTAFVRSPYPAAKINSIDSTAALAHPGVVAVLTGKDLAADIAAGLVNECRTPYKLERPDGNQNVETPRPLMARDRVRMLGEVVAMVIADGDLAAQDAAELVAVDYEQQPAVASLAAAMQADAPQLWEDRPGNQAYHWRQGDPDKVDAALAASHHVARLKSAISRVSAVPLEPRCALAYLGEDGRPVLRLATQSPQAQRNELASTFGLKPADLRVIAAEVGGSFGLKQGPQKEEFLVFWAARRLRRPVRWTATRAESFLCDEHARDLQVTSELGLDAQGRFTALRVRYDNNVGAYMSGRSTTSIVNFGTIAGVYTTPVIVGEAFGWFTNTQVTGPYRGAGRPEATYAIERIIDIAAAEMGIDPAELRQRNLIPPEAMPYQTPFMFKYDTGDYGQNMRKALELADYAGFPRRREEARRRGKLRGIGIANPIETAGGPLLSGAVRSDWSTVQAHADGTVSLLAGHMSVGQGLDTTLSTVVAQRLGLPLEKVRYVQGDTDVVPNGRGNGASSGLSMGGTATLNATDDLLEKARQIAATELEASPHDLGYTAGMFRVVGSDHAINLADVARAARDKPKHGGATLAGVAQFGPPEHTFPSGCHLCEVEIDPETGRVRVVNYVSVEDVGHVLNPMLVDGQIHGGVAQGIGQALLEEIRFDAEGQLVTGSFMDYTMPRATDIPDMVSEHVAMPTPQNGLGAKGVGEAGTTGALVVTLNAVCNALQQAGVRHLDMPATPMRVWQALHDAGFAPATKKDNK